MYDRHLYVGWGDLDANGHMRNTAYLDKAADVRLFYFAEHGFPAAEFARIGVGPVVRRDAIEYFRECRMLDPIRVTFAVAALSPDAARFAIVNEFWRGDRLAARVVSSGGWLDQRARALVAPPPALAEVLRSAPRTDAFEELPGL
jgi:acyl-CoA thioester hydrolase